MQFSDRPPLRFLGPLPPDKGNSEGTWNEVLGNRFLGNRFLGNRFLGNRFLKGEPEVADEQEAQAETAGLQGASRTEPELAVVAGGAGQPVGAYAMINQADAPSCSDCGSIMIRSGACYKCPNCGSTSGCS